MFTDTLAHHEHVVSTLPVLWPFIVGCVYALRWFIPRKEK